MPRLIYSGDTTDAFGKFLPTPVFNGIKILSVTADDTTLQQARRTYETLSSDVVDLSSMARIEVNTSLLFNSDDTFKPEDYFSNLLGNTTTPSLFLNIIAIKNNSQNQDPIGLLKIDKLNLSNIRSALDEVQVSRARYADIVGSTLDVNNEFVINDLLNKTMYQVYSIPYSTDVRNYEFSNDTDEDGNPIFITGNNKFSFLISDFKFLKEVTVFACISTQRMSELSLQSKAMFALNFSDISYEDIKINGKIAKFGDPIYVDSNNVAYSQIPMMALDSKFYKTEPVSQDDLNSSLKNITDKYNRLVNTDKTLRNQLNNVLFVQQSFLNNPELLPNLQKTNSLSPSKNSGTNTGRMYDEIRIVINNFNSALLSQEQVVKRIYRNFKILDLREVLEIDISPSFDETLELPVVGDRNLIYRNKIHSNIAKYVPITSEMNYPGKAELPVTSTERRNRVNTNVSALKLQLKDLFKNTILNSIEELNLDDVLDDADNWLSGFGKFWSGKDTEYEIRRSQITGITRAGGPINDRGPGELVGTYTSNAQLYLASFDSLNSIPGISKKEANEALDFTRNLGEITDSSMINGTFADQEFRIAPGNKELSYTKMNQLYSWIVGTGGKVQLIFPKTISTTSTTLPSIGSNKSNYVQEANEVVEEFDIFDYIAKTGDVSKSKVVLGNPGFGPVPVPLIENTDTSFVVGMSIKDNESEKSSFKEKARDAIIRHLTTNGQLADGFGPNTPGVDNAGLSYNFYKVADSINSSFDSLIDETIDSLLDNPTLVNQLLTENSRDEFVVSLFNSLKIKLSKVLKSKLENGTYIAFLAVPYCDYKFGKSESAAKASLAKVSDDSDHGIVYGKYKLLEDRFNPGYASDGSMWYRKIDLTASLKETILDEFVAQKDIIENALENIIEQIIGFESLTIDTRLMDTLASIDIIIQKSGYFFFDYEKFIRKRSFMSRYMNVGRLIDFTSQGKAITNAAATIKKVKYDNKTYGTTLELERDLAVPSDPTEYKTFSFRSTRDANGNLMSYPIAPIESVMTFKDFFNESRDIEQTLDMLSPKEAYSKITQRNFNFTNFNDGLLREGVTWKDDYRLYMFNYQFFIDDDKYNQETILTDSGRTTGPRGDGDSRDIQTIEVQVEDNSGQTLLAIIDRFEVVYRQFVDEYYNVAIEQCSYNEFTNSFNTFFVSAILEKYPGNSNPWSKMVSLYTLYLNIFTDTFRGEYVSMIEFGEKLLSSIRPETGTLDRLISINNQLSIFNERLNQIKYEAIEDGFTYSTTQTISITNDIERKILDHIGDYSEVSDMLDLPPEPPELL
mgnify:FL=1